MLRRVRVMLSTACTPDDRKTLCVARSLAGRGARVSVASDRPWGLACWSRSVARRLRCEDPRHDPVRYVESLERLLAGDRHDVLIPTNDYTTAAAAAHAGRLSRLARLAVPPSDSLTRAQDKFAVAMLGRELGIETPRTRLAQAAGEVPALVADIGLPCVVKFRRGSGAVGLRIVREPDGWRAAGDERREPDLVYDYRQFLVQEFVPGDTHDVCVVCCRGDLRAAVSQRRLRTYPAAGGVGVDCITTNEPALVEQASVLMRALRWHGPAQVEFKVDAAAGRAWLIEVNGRLWGTLALAVWAGVDVPWMLCRLALDGDVRPQWDYRVGARYRWTLPLGLLHAAQSNSPGRALRDLFMRSPATSGDWWWTDPWPHAAEALYAAQRMWGRGRIGPEHRNPLGGVPS